MKLPLRIALRYLFARKSHNVINVISGISVAGMAVGTAAMVIIMSVFNGFDSLIGDALGNIDPDIRISPSAGKVFTPDSTAFDRLYRDDRIARISSVLEEQVFLSYMDKQGVCTMKGVDQVYEQETPLRNCMVEGNFSLHRGAAMPQAVFGVSLAYSMGINHRLLTPVEVFYPSRNAPFSVQNPTASLRQKKVFPAGNLSVNSEIDGTLAVVPIEVMRELLEYDSEISALEIVLAPGASCKAVIRDIEDIFGPGFEVKDRIRQNDALYKMMRYEKLAIYLILIFVVIIIAFSVLNSLTMLMIEKEQDMETLRSLGADAALTRSIFRLEGWMISLLGMVIGLIAGTALVLAQQRFGLIAMPGGFAVEAYPVILKAADFLYIIGGVALIGYLIACIPTLKMQGR